MGLSSVLLFRKAKSLFENAKADSELLYDKMSEEEKKKQSELINALGNEYDKAFDALSEMEKNYELYREKPKSGVVSKEAKRNSGIPY